MKCWFTVTFCETNSIRLLKVYCANPKINFDIRDCPRDSLYIFYI